MRGGKSTYYRRRPGQYTSWISPEVYARPPVISANGADLFGGDERTSGHPPSLRVAIADPAARRSAAHRIDRDAGIEKRIGQFGKWRRSAVPIAAFGEEAADADDVLAAWKGREAVGEFPEGGWVGHAASSLGAFQAEGRFEGWQGLVHPGCVRRGRRGFPLGKAVNGEHGALIGQDIEIEIPGGFELPQGAHGFVPFDAFHAGIREVEDDDGYRGLGVGTKVEDRFGLPVIEEAEVAGLQAGWGADVESDEHLRILRYGRNGQKAERQ